MAIDTPRDAAQAVIDRPVLWSGTDERMAGYGIMGQPFDSGHYLALRHFPATSLGAGYRSVWHRNPAGEWTFYATSAAERSCSRYFSAAAQAATRTPVELDWDGPYALRVRIPDVLEWRIELASSGFTRVFNRVGPHIPVAAWRSDRLQALMGRAVGPMLRAGQVRMSGTVPNGQHFAAGPRLMWLVSDSRARLHGADLGKPAPLPRQQRLGDFRLPQRGMFVVANAVFEAFDPTRHRSVALSPAVHPTAH
ncbi:hypothetical protein [Nocardia spumae]|uniref:hypothetical protein n=1 Tax=Nocardia spumae TaxID=2887190 RepID=UPI001D13E260|nr:hypothetical protein [Nocardia spumae]